MEPSFEIKYLEIKWYDKNTVASLTESQFPLPLHYDDDRHIFECESTIYPKADDFHGQLGIRLLNGDVIPYAEMADGNMEPLFKIEDEISGRNWWVLNYSWDSKYRYWKFRDHNTPGTLVLQIGLHRCEIQISSSDFTRVELDEYLQSFSDGIWELVVDNSSPIHAERLGIGHVISDEVLNYVSQMMACSEAILRAPKSELREVQKLLPRKEVKPVNRTFRELCSRSNQKRLTSRSAESSYNVPDNRYVLFALERSYLIISKLARHAHRLTKRYSNKVLHLEKQIDSLKQDIKINIDLARNDLLKLKERKSLEYWEDQLKKRIFENSIELAPRSKNHQEIFIKLKGVATKLKSPAFFIEKHIDGKYQNVEGKVSFLVFNPSSVDLSSILMAGFEYRITGLFKEVFFSDSYRLMFTAVSEIEVWDGDVIRSAKEAFKADRSKCVSLTKNNWSRQLSPKELEEQERHRRVLSKKISAYQEQKNNTQNLSDSLRPKVSKMKSILTRFKRLKITPSSKFTNSMTFVHNPNYQGVHSSFRYIKEASNLADDDIFDGLEEIDKMGLVNMPLLYERWCLVQILSVLTTSFKFSLSGNWKHRLIKAVRMRQFDVEFLLRNECSQRAVTVTYEKHLQNGKRPDFVLDVSWVSRVDNSPVQKGQKRFVFDAKFYDKETFERLGGFLEAINQLRSGSKNYSESGSNPVFIIHPCRNAMPTRVTAQDWGEISYMGELPLGDMEVPKHQYGAIYLNPIDSTLYNDELQRLLGLCLQYGLEDEDTTSSDSDLTISPPICLSCGSSNFRKVDKRHTYKTKTGKESQRSSRSVWLECGECHQFVSFNHCSKCHARLIKNGLYWTYHSVKAIEPFNVKCPACQSWGNW